MDARLWMLIRDYRLRVGEALAMLEGAGAARGTGAGQWSDAGGPQRGPLPHGFAYERDGAAYRVQGPAWSVHFELDADGRVDGFNPSRLFELARRRFSCYGFKSEQEFRSAVQHGLEAGELRLSGSLHYLTDIASPPRATSAPVTPTPAADDATDGTTDPMPDKRRRFIARWQIACGTLGLLGYVLYSFDIPRGTRRILTEVTGPYNIVLGILFFGACIRFGFYLLRGERRGVIGSIVCLALQVVTFAILGGPHVAISAGPHISLRLASDGFNMSAGFASAFFIGTRIAGPAWEMSINLLAFFWTVMLLRLARSRVETVPQGAVPSSSTAGAQPMGDIAR